MGERATHASKVTTAAYRAITGECLDRTLLSIVGLLRSLAKLMDLRKALDERIRAIADGEHKAGLEAVSRHIDAAMRHHERGRKESDDTAYSDAIYRCNQAFEGSVKEAYRVIAQQNPERKSTAQIEEFLSNGALLRARVLAQLTSYRQEWRNPSTHDYKLDFDEDEALLAIVSVSAFAVVLCDQIIEKLTFIATQRSAAGAAQAQTGATLLERIATSVRAFTQLKRSDGLSDNNPVETYRAIEAVLAGFLSSVLPDATIEMHAALSASVRSEVDVLISAGTECVAIELKVLRDRRNFVNRVDDATMQALKILRTPQITGVVVALLCLEADDYIIWDSEFGHGRLKMVAPASKAL